MEPSYLTAYENGTLERIIGQAQALLRSCEICPRRCKVDRLSGTKGYCHTGAHASVYSYMAHRGEEPPVSGSRGSGAIFFARCNMACVYCQNHEFSQRDSGREVSAGELADIMLALQGQGCHNINLVTPTHVMPQILSALKAAIDKGLRIPLVYNTGGYELPSIIASLEGVIDIYLPDMRYGDAEPAARYSDAPEYPRYNRAALKEMHRQVGVPRIDTDGIIERGLIVRHLVLPGGISGTHRVMRFLGEEISADTYISLMSQYTPYYRAAESPSLNRRLQKQEYHGARQIMEQYGLSNGWVQEDGGLQALAGVHIKPR